MIETAGLVLRTGERTLLANFDWRAKSGECWAVVGRNGTGKSTLLKTLCALQAPAAGQIRLGDTALAALSPAARARRIGYLPQSHADAFGYRVFEMVLAARHPHLQGYWESDDDRAVARQALAALDIAHLAERDVRTLSGGERQRAALAALLAQDTPLMLLDEPAAALDLAHQISLLARLRSLAQQAGKGIVLVSHELNLTLAHASHVLLLFGDGRWHATPTAALDPALLGDCLGYPLDAVRHHDQTLYLPRTRTTP